MYITITLVMMGKMMSILFLVLVLLISLGLSQLTNVSEGMETAEQAVEEEPILDKSPSVEEVDDVPSNPKGDMVSDNDKLNSEVVPMEGGLTENMSNYR